MQIIYDLFSYGCAISLHYQSGSQKETEFIPGGSTEEILTKELFTNMQTELRNKQDGEGMNDETSNSEKTVLPVETERQEKEQHFHRSPVKGGGMEEGSLEGVTA